MMTYDHMSGLTESGFTEAQAAAITYTVQTTAHEAVETLGQKLARWHAYLALYLLVQIAIVLLAILLVQTLREPQRLASRPEIQHRQLVIGSDSW